MTYPNMDLQSLPGDIELRVGTDQAERALQLSYYHVTAALQALNIIDDLGLVPEVVENAGEEANFATQLDGLMDDLVAALAHYDTIFGYTP